MTVPPTPHTLRRVVTYAISGTYNPDAWSTAYTIKSDSILLDGLDALAVIALRSASIMDTIGIPFETYKRRAEVARKRLYRAERSIAVNPATLILSTDEQGAFRKNLLPGTYWVHIHSKARGGAECGKVEVIAEDVKVKTRFELE